jgi:hypothetical protein
MDEVTLNLPAGVASTIALALITVNPFSKFALTMDPVRLLPIRPRSRGERRSLRTFAVVTLHPRFPFNV